MVDENLIGQLDKLDEGLDAELNELFAGGFGETAVDSLISDEEEEYKAGTILKGKIVGWAGDDVVVDVGLKSEGIIPVEEWDDKSEIEVGDEVDVWLDLIEADNGLVQLSKRKADRQLNWQRISETSNEGDMVKGKVMRKIKGGLLVDIGVPVFLPASQVDIRPSWRHWRVHRQ